MNKKLILLVLILLISALPIRANSNWVQIADKVYIDINSIRKEGDSEKKISFWHKWLNDKSQVFQMHENIFPDRKAWYVLKQVIIDCENKEATTKSFYVYDINNEVVFQDTIPEYSWEWMSIPPDSFLNFCYNFVCNKSQ